MDGWIPNHEVLRQHHKELLREAEERRLASTLRKSRRARRKRQKSRTFPGFVAALATILRTSPLDARACGRSGRRLRSRPPRRKGMRR